MAVRIKGLVSAFNDVRAQLQAGIGKNQEKRFTDHVHVLVARVEEICAASGTTPDSLPSPSRRAYAFLKGLDARELPSLSVARTATAVPRLRVANVVKGADVFSKRMWNELPRLLDSEGDRDRLASGILDCVSWIEAACSRLGASPDSLEAPSRRAYGWLKFLLNEDNLCLHLAALNRGRSALLKVNPGPERVEIHLANMNSIWRSRIRCKLVLMKVNEGFLHADDRVWQTLMSNAVKKHGIQGRVIVNEFTNSEVFSGVLFEVASFTEIKASSSGLVHDLDDSFNRVNMAYFEGSLAKPRLRWNHILTARKFGHYEFARDTVMLSVSLDDAAVPESVFDFVMHHELLHKKHGVKLMNGRRMAHTSAFRIDELRFTGYEDAVVCLNALATRLGSH